MDLLNSAKNLVSQVGPLADLKKNALKALNEFKNINCELLEQIESLQSALGPLAPCLGIKQCFGCIKPHIIDPKLDNVRSSYDKFKQASNSIEEIFKKPLLKTIASKSAIVQEFLNLIFDINNACDKIFSDDLEMEDLTSSLDSVHDILSTKTPRYLDKVEEMLK